MRLQHVVLRVEAWKGDIMARCTPLLEQARTELVAAQNEPNADERIAQREEALVAAIDSVMDAGEAVLDTVRENLSLFFENVDEASLEEQAVADRLDQADTLLRDWLTRKVASLVAQARAQELMPTAPARAPEVIDVVASTLPGQAIRPLRPTRLTQMGHVSPDAIAQRYEPPATDPTLPSPTKRFCTECGGPLVTDASGARRCARCGA